MKNNNIKKRKFFFLKRIILSITNFSAYSTFNREPLSAAIKYFLLLVLVLNIIPFILFGRTLQVEIKDFKNWLVKSLPKMWIKDGVLSCEGEQPIKLVYRDFLNLIIDTNDNIKRIDPEIDACILLNSRKITVKFFQSKHQSYNISEALSMEINEETLTGYEKRIFYTLVPISGVIIFIFSVLKKSMEIIFFSILLSTVYSVYCIGKKISSSRKLKEFFVTGIYTITAPFCLETLTGITGFHFDYFFILYYGLYLYCLFQVFRTVIVKQTEITDNLEGLSS